IFNLEQCELPQAVLDKLPKAETHEHTPISACAEIIGCMPNAPEIQHAGSKAFYSALTERVTLPPPELFTSTEEYYATGFHELIHYADFRIMPCLEREPARLMGRGRVKSA
ncbi:MAG: zincin-like metallopeptidase domain-containing protein, partial [Terriglobia bacterium]